MTSVQCSKGGITMKIKKCESGLKAHDSELVDFDADSQDLRQMEGDFIIKTLEENIRLRETSLLKKLIKK